MTKSIENSPRDVNIAFANELSTICDELQINVWEFISMANRYPRVNILQLSVVWAATALPILGLLLTSLLNEQC